jgi:hypothetical protein
MCIKCIEKLMSDRTVFNHGNWHRHRGDGGQFDAPYEFHDAVDDGAGISRQMIFEAFRRSTQEGIVLALEWGFPRGRFPGGSWRPLAEAFRSPELCAAIEELRDLEDGDACEIITQLNAVIPGLSTASTSKLAYFARLNSRQGPCLILDSRVIAATRRLDVESYPEFGFVKTMLGGAQNLQRSPTPARVVSAYGAYLTAIHGYTARRIHERGLETHADQIEFALFQSNRNSAPCLE